MKLVINDTLSVRDLQLAFNSMFPYLKLEFFRNGTVLEKMYALEKLLPKTSTIGELWTRKQAAEIDIEETTKVKDLEKTFMDMFGLTIQIFRRSGNLWLETTMTDNWTLKQQNEHGKEITTGKPRPDDRSDFDLHRGEQD